MAIIPVEFVNVRNVRAGVRANGNDGFTLIITDGVAIINFTGGNNQEFGTRNQVTFLVPNQRATNPADPASALTVTFLDASASVFPAAALSFGGDPFGFAVDRVDAVSEGNHVRITADVVIGGVNTTFFRVGFHVSILSFEP
jgi:hypothetical protein